MKKTLAILLLIFLINKGFSQERTLFASDRNDFWKLISISGEFKVEGLYESQKRTTLNYIDYPKMSSLLGGLKLDTKSYLWHPNFLKIELGGEFNPETKNKKYQIFDDRSEVKSRQRINFKATFFDGKPISFNVFTNYLNGRNNIENIARVNLNNFSWGGGIISRNKYIPFTIFYKDYKIKQEELLNNRVFNIEGKNILARMSKSFSRNDGHQLTYSYNEFFREQIGTYIINTTSHRIQLLNKYYFDKKRNYFFNSTITNLNRSGIIDFNNLRVVERLSFKLPKRFVFGANYLYHNFRTDSTNKNQNDIKLELNHKLFKSLNTRIHFKKSIIDHSYFNERNQETGIDIIYTKAIPLGRLYLSYKYKRLMHGTESSSESIYIYNEEHVLQDGEFQLLDRPYIDPASIVVKDLSGSFVYQQDLDYVIYERNNFIEIQRVPGGQINNNSIILIDYMATLPGNYEYDINLNTFNAKLSFFKRAIELSYSYMQKDYLNLYQTDFIPLDYLTQHKYGISTNRKFLKAGVEYSERESTVFPHNLTYYYLSSQKRVKRFLFIVNAGFKNYNLLEEEIDQNFYNISGKAVMQIGSNSKINFNIGYANQSGQRIYLDLFTSKLEYSLTIKELSFACGLQYYHRYLTNDKMNLSGGYFRIIRKF